MEFFLLIYFTALHMAVYYENFDLLHFFECLEGFNINSIDDTGV